MKKSKKFPKTGLEEVFKKLKKILKIRQSADVFFLSNKEMEGVRRVFLKLPTFKGKEAQKIKKEKRVNVLSLPYGEASVFKTKSLGEIFINSDFVAGSKEVLVFLFIHGFLHLLGYEHDTKHGIIRMEKEEKRLFRKIFPLVSSQEYILIRKRSSKI